MPPGGVLRRRPQGTALVSKSATVVPDGLCSAEDVLDTLLGFAGEVTDRTAHLLIRSLGPAPTCARATAARLPGRVAGLTLICPLLPGLRDVPEHRVIVGVRSATTGHALPHEQPHLLRALFAEWLARVERSG